MPRAIGSVILGYLTMAVIVFGGLTAAYLAMGTDKAFKPGSYEISTVWMVAMFIVGIVAALAGGVVARLIAKSATPPKVLAGIVLLLGIAMAIPTIGAKPPAEPRPATMSNLEAMSKAHTPAWVGFANAVLGCVGVLIGTGLIRPKVGMASPAPPA